MTLMLKISSQILVIGKECNARMTHCLLDGNLRVGPKPGPLLTIMNEKVEGDFLSSLRDDNGR